MADRIIFSAWALSALAETLLLARLTLLGLVRRYRWFAAWLAIDLVHSLVVWLLTRQPEQYKIEYPIGQTLVFLAQVMAIREIFRLHLSHYHGIRSAGTKILAILALGAIGISLLFLTITGDFALSSFFAGLLSAQQVATAAITLFLLTSVAFFKLNSVRTRKNILIIERVAAIYFGSQTVAYLAVLLARNKPNSTGNEIGALVWTVLSTVCFGLWTVLISRAGEYIESGPTPTDRDLEKLDRLNAEAARFVESFRWSPQRGLH